MNTRETKGIKMAPWRPRGRGNVIVFLSVVGCFLAVAMILMAGAPDYRRHEIDMSTMSDTQLILETGLNRADVAAIKLGHVERSSPYDVLLLGNHQFKYFGESAFGEGSVRPRFFNLWYANLSISELADLAEFLADQGKLPRRLLLLQITSPNNDNGMYIVGSNGELLPDIREFAGEMADRSVFEQVRDEFSNVVDRVKRMVDYATLVHSVLGRTQLDRLIDTVDCNPNELVGQRDTHGIGTLMSGLLGGDGVDQCNPATWINAFGRDGARLDKYVVADPTLDANPLDPQGAYLSVADIPELTADMRRIHVAADRAGATAVFIVPPVYESDRQSTVDQVLDLVLENTPELNVIDHRFMRHPPTLFVTYDHPSSEYFHALTKDLVARGFLATRENE